MELGDGFSIWALGFLSIYNKDWQLAILYKVKIMANICLNWLLLLRRLVISFLPSITLYIHTGCTGVDLERSFQKPKQFSVTRDAFRKKGLGEVGAIPMGTSS